MLVWWVSRYYDVIVLGGGFNGVLCGIGLSRSGLSVLLVEKKEEILLGVEERVFALSKKSKSILEELDIWSDHLGCAPINHIMIYDGSSCSYVHYDYALVGSQPMGYIVEAKELAKSIRDKIGFDVVTSDIYESIATKGGFIELRLSSGTMLRSRLVVCCEGKNSPLRDIMSIKTMKYDFNQSCFTCNVQHTKHHYNTAIEHFFPGGPFAVLPMRGGFTSSIVMTERSDVAEMLCKVPTQEFQIELEKKCSSFLGNVEITSGIHCFKISMVFSEKQYKGRVILLGDSYHAIHPIAGQGLNLGIRDVNVLVDVIRKYNSLGSDIGHEFILKEIENRRLLDNFSMSLITTGMNYVFTRSSTLIKIARRAIMSMVEMSPHVKKALIEHAMGISSISR